MNFLVVVDFMMIKVMELKLGCGLNYVIGLMIFHQSIIMVNIKMIKELIDGILRTIDLSCNIILLK